MVVLMENAKLLQVVGLIMNQLVKMEILIIVLKEKKVLIKDGLIVHYAFKEIMIVIIIVNVLAVWNVWALEFWRVH